MNKKFKAVTILIFLLSILFAVSAGAATRVGCIRLILDNTDIDCEKADAALLKKFSDKGDLDPYDRSVVCAALENGIITGYDDNTIKPYKEITRAEFACMVYRAKDLLKSVPSERITYNGKYKDLSDWNSDAIYYCIEHGIMLGYSDKFGSSDVITDAQCEILKNRIIFGLTTRERYSLLNICGDSPIPISDFLNSAYNEELKNAELTGLAPEESVIDKDSAVISEFMEKFMDMQGNMDYEKLSDNDYKEYILNNLKSSGIYGTKRPTNIITRNGTQTVDEIIADAEARKVKRESIFVFSPQNNKETNFMGMYIRKAVVGYEYYCYKEISGETPYNEEIGVWYRRRADIYCTQYKTASSQYTDVECKYGEPEKI